MLFNLRGVENETCKVGVHFGQIVVASEFEPKNCPEDQENVVGCDEEKKEKGKHPSEMEPSPKVKVEFEPILEGNKNLDHKEN